MITSEKTKALIISGLTMWILGSALLPAHPGRVSMLHFLPLLAGVGCLVTGFVLGWRVRREGGQFSVAWLIAGGVLLGLTIVGMVAVIRDL